MWQTLNIFQIPVKGIEKADVPDIVFMPAVVVDLVHLLLGDDLYHHVLGVGAQLLGQLGGDVERLAHRQHTLRARVGHVPQQLQTVTALHQRHHTASHCINGIQGAGRSSEVERSLMVRWVVGSILHGVDPLSYFSFQPVLHDWCNKGCGMYYPVCGMVHIKEPLLLIDKSSLCGSSRFPFSLSCVMPYNRK